MKERFRVTIYRNGKTPGPRWVDAETAQEAAALAVGCPVCLDEDFEDGKHYMIKGCRQISIWSRLLSEP
jgi:hypothetical protein